MSKILRLLDLSFEAWATLDHTFHERLAGDLYEAIEDVRNENNTSPKEWYSMNKIYINEDIGYLPAGEALKHLTDDWICGGNVSHETILNMRDVISYLHSELQEYKTLGEYPLTSRLGVKYGYGQTGFPKNAWRIRAIHG